MLNAKKKRKKKGCNNFKAKNKIASKLPKQGKYKNEISFLTKLKVSRNN